ncbi:endolytic transglycosylase MltG [Oceanospirillum linum]|uniref:endolytic transglycosylase MltG n=1 Tax=Oceanospirillum linum TaxID=966 RepID=UPI00089F71A4|nr:endolytic transglycosylase MltG [Oceanospirillum linum]SEF49829.1 UPF0755 protein [Oleiphilus messinensis]SMP03665.1 UPF0755 protein [Oceanospirillum linum]
MFFLNRRVIAALAGVAVLIPLLSFVYWKQLLQQPLPLSESMIYDVKSGFGAHHVMAELNAEGILPDTWPLKIWLKINPEKAQLKAGEYRIPAGISAYELMGLLTSGKTVQYQVTLPEGLNFSEALQLLQQQEKLAVKTRDMSIADIMQWVSGKSASAVEHHEGRFFPDTYQYHKGMTDLQILKLAYEKMNRVLNDEWQKADQAALPYSNAYEALIMASIVEKETGVPEERSRIAGVFVQRLEKRMRLQTDPTVIYGLGDRYQGNITRSHLKEKTAYNTYRINGLPPTPIALPGRDAIHAALNPLKEGELYFVARGDGSHKFSKTLQEHNKAVRHYQIYKRKQNYQSSPEAQ